MKKWSASSILAIFSYAALLVVTFIIPPSVSSSSGNPLNVHVTLRGKNYDISNVSTVRELQKNVEDRSGLLPSKQSVLFGGQKLKPSDILSDVGVEEGSVINIVPLSSSSGSSNKKKKSTSNKSSSSSLSSPTGTSSSSSSATGDSSTSDGSSSSPGNMMEELMKQAGLDASKLDEMMKAMGGGASGAGGGMPDMKQSMEMMQEMMNSPLFQEYFNDPEKLEQSRQMILQNPMMKGMMASLPGFEDILNDEVKWRETMMAASQMYKEMGSMMGGAGAGMFGDGLAGLGAAKDTLNAALDELSEGEL